MSAETTPLRVGVIGLSRGNGHPFSFSALVNGYADAGWPGAGWDVIWRYLRERDPAEFGFPGVRVIYAWTQDAGVTAKLCAACRIPTAVNDPADFIGQVDAVLLARDDVDTHAALAMPLLEAGLSVFVDKPLALDEAELERFTPYLRRGQLTSCSGFRYSRELDAWRAGNRELGELRLIRGAVLNDFEHYGIHLLLSAPPPGGCQYASQPSRRVTRRWRLRSRATCSSNSARWATYPKLSSSTFGAQVGTRRSS